MPSPKAKKSPNAKSPVKVAPGMTARNATAVGVGVGALGAAAYAAKRFWPNQCLTDRECPTGDLSWMIDSGAHIEDHKPPTPENHHENWGIVMGAIAVLSGLALYRRHRSRGRDAAEALAEAQKADYRPTDEFVDASEPDQQHAKPSSPRKSAGASPTVDAAQLQANRQLLKDVFMGRI